MRILGAALDDARGYAGLLIATAVAVTAIVATALLLTLLMALRPMPSVVARGCEAAQHVTLPTEGWRIIADGTFVEKRRAVPGPAGTLLFNDRAGRARCLRPVA